MIDLDPKAAPIDVAPLPPAEAPKFFEIEQAQGMLIVLRDLTFLDQYRAEFKDRARIYSDVRIELPDGSIKLFSIDEFIKRING